MAEQQKTGDWQERYRNAILGVFGRPQLCLDHGHGCVVVDSDGKEYLDLLAGIAVNALGYAHPAWVEAVIHQSETLAHVSNFFTTGPAGSRRKTPRTGESTKGVGSVSLELWY
ncbi:acetylornithine aminotransferase [Cutibacterium acnes JCM 18920]|nr:acetylornithine aminotransferase [Cutibacterium acnes JCM 18920]